MESQIGFGGVPLGFATDAPRGSAGSFTLKIWLTNIFRNGVLKECGLNSAPTPAREHRQ